MPKEYRLPVLSPTGAVTSPDGLPNTRPTGDEIIARVGATLGTAALALGVVSHLAPGAMETAHGAASHNHSPLVDVFEAGATKVEQEVVGVVHNLATQHSGVQGISALDTLPHAAQAAHSATLPPTAADHTGTYDTWHQTGFDGSPLMNSTDMHHDSSLMHSAQQATQGGGSQPIPHDAWQSPDFLEQVALHFNPNNIDAPTVLGNPDAFAWMTQHHPQELLTAIQNSDWQGNGQDFPLGHYESTSSLDGHYTGIVWGAQLETVKDSAGNNQQIVLEVLTRTPSGHYYLEPVTIGKAEPGLANVSISTTNDTGVNGTTGIPNARSLQEEVNWINGTGKYDGQGSHLGEQVLIIARTPQNVTQFQPYLPGESPVAAQDAINLQTIAGYQPHQLQALAPTNDNLQALQGNVDPSKAVPASIVIFKD